MRRIRRISLRDFRSYAQLDLNLDGRSVALAGPNGAGKTNLLEALSFIAPGRGMRRAVLNDVTRQKSDATAWGIGLSLLGADDIEPVTLSVQVDGSPLKRKLRIDGEPAKTASSLLDYVRFSWLTPAHDRLFMEGASERRRFLDRMVLAQDKVHATTSSAYEKAMRQRQAVLNGDQPLDPTLLGILERQMAEHGVAIAAARRYMVAVLSAGYERLRSGAFPAAKVELQGALELALHEQSAAIVEDDFATELERGRRRDAEAGRALSGPHRSDLLVFHLDKDQPARLCSTGEQKALLIGLVLAHAAALDTHTDVPLVLLLDEVAAHLDSARRGALADILEQLGCQVFMTGTDSELFAPWGDRAAHFIVSDGEVRPADI